MFCFFFPKTRFGLKKTCSTMPTRASVFENTWNLSTLCMFWEFYPNTGSGQRWVPIHMGGSGWPHERPHRIINTTSVPPAKVLVREKMKEAAVQHARNDDLGQWSWIFMQVGIQEAHVALSGTFKIKNWSLSDCIKELNDPSFTVSFKWILLQFAMSISFR